MFSPCRHRAESPGPSQTLLDQCIVTVPPVNSLGRTEIVVSFELNSRDLFHNVHQLIDRNQLVTAKIKRILDITIQNHLSSLQAVINIHEAASLIARAPDFDLLSPRQFRFDHFAADGRRRLFAASRPGAMWSVNIMVACNSCLEAEVLPEVPAHALTEKLFPSVSILGMAG